MELLAFALSAALAQILTNLDNLAVLLLVALPVGVFRAALCYVVAQALMLLFAMVFAAGAAELLTVWVGWLGFVPLGLGLWALWRQYRGKVDDEQQVAVENMPLAGLMALFLSLSVDSFTVMTALLADSTSVYRLAVLLGAVAAIAMIAVSALVLSRMATRSGSWLNRLERLGPYAMIAAGAYVLSNTGTDILPG